MDRRQCNYLSWSTDTAGNDTTVDITAITDTPVKLGFTPDGQRVVLIAEHVAKAKMPPLKAVFFALNGRRIRQIVHEV